MLSSEELDRMLDLEVLLEFRCCACGSPIKVTLRCEGEGLAEDDAKALAKVPCPSCHRANQVIFEPESGRVIDVMREIRICRMPEFSLN